MSNVLAKYLRQGWSAALLAWLIGVWLTLSVGFSDWDWCGWDEVCLILSVGATGDCCAPELKLAEPHDGQYIIVRPTTLPQDWQFFLLVKVIAIPLVHNEQFWHLIILNGICHEQVKLLNNPNPGKITLKTQSQPSNRSVLHLTAINIVPPGNWARTNIIIKNSPAAVPRRFWINPVEFWLVWVPRFCEIVVTIGVPSTEVPWDGATLWPHDGQKSIVLPSPIPQFWQTIDVTTTSISYWNPSYSK